VNDLLVIDDELLALASPSELSAYRAWLEAESLADAERDLEGLEKDWKRWLWGVFPHHVSAGFAPHHEELWRWVWSIEAGQPAHPYVAVWARGAGKSSTAEMAVVALGARKKRQYVIWCGATQAQADDHVQNIAALLEGPGISRLYPALATRQLGKYGNSRGWRRNRLWTSTGFVVDALGLDTAARGVKIEDQRPDMALLDDLDEEHDSKAAVDRKEATLTRKLLPAGTGHMAVLAVQNLVHVDSIFSRLADGSAEYLARRTVSGPVPAIEGLSTQRREGRSIIIAGRPTWDGQDLDACQHAIDEYGESAFRIEAQHEVSVRAGGIFSHLEYEHCAPEDVPELVRVAVWVDPAVTDTDQSDSMGIQADGLGVDGRVYRLRTYEQRSSPRLALGTAIRWAYDLGADTVGVETDQGGDTWASVYREALADVEKPEGARAPRFRWEKAGAGHGPKVARAMRMLVFYERNPSAFVHVLGYHTVLENALNRFPLTKPHDAVDASYWAAHDLLGGIKRKVTANPSALRQSVSMSHRG